MLALLLAGIGLFGIRIALGAQTRNVLWLIIGEGMLLAVLGVLLGLGGAFGLTRMMQTMLYGVSPTDLPTLAVITALLLLAALPACWIPARRATKVDPLMALRCE